MDDNSQVLSFRMKAHRKMNKIAIQKTGLGGGIITNKKARSFRFLSPKIKRDEKPESVINKKQTATKA